MSIFKFFSAVAEPIATMVDALHTSDDEKNQFKLSLARLLHDKELESFKYERELMAGRLGVIEAEAKSDSWLAASWRPITMLSFLSLIIADAFGLLPKPLDPGVITLLQLGIGGYVIGRSVEKTAKETGLKQIFAKKILGKQIKEESGK